MIIILKLFNLNELFDINLIYMSLAFKIFILSFLIGIGFYAFINCSLYRMTELDYLQQKINFGRLVIEMKASQTIQLKSFTLTIKKKFNFTFHAKQVFKGDNDNFLTIMKANGNIQSNGDSFYQISDSIQKVCKIQVISSIYIKLLSQRSTIVIQGFFLDCEQSKYKILIHQNQFQDMSINVTLPQQNQKTYSKKIYNRILISFDDKDSNIYYGLGEQFSYLSLGKDRPYSTFVRQKGVGRTEQPLTLLSNLLHGAGGSYYTSYAPMPIWMSNQRFGYILDQYSYSGWINNKIYVWSNQLNLIVISKKSYKSIIKQITLYNGYTEIVPDWVNQGAIVGLQGGTQNVTSKFMTLKNAGSKITGVWIQDWVSKRMSLGYSRLWWNWQLDQKHYLNWDQMKKMFQTQNISTLIYVNPMLTDPSKKQNVRNNYYEIAKQKNLFVKNSDGRDYQTRAVSDFSASLLNFSNVQATNFFSQIIQKALKQTGAKGMMVDFSEAYPVQNMGQQSIQKASQHHNFYPTLYHQKVNEIINNLFGKQNEFYIFNRAGYYKSPKYADSLWAGDQNMNFNFHTGLQSCLTAILSSGLVGYSNTHCDIGGYMQIHNEFISFAQRTQILMIRWMQLSAFTAVFRSHEGNNPDNTYQVYTNQYLSQNFAFYSNVFSILSSYRKIQSKKSNQQKIPLVRPLFVQLENQNQNDSQTQTIKLIHEVQDQFYLGSQLIVAPFLTKEDFRKYFLPKGEWIQIWGGKVYKGCDCIRNWKGYLPPVFIKSSCEQREQIILNIKKLIEKYKAYVLKTPQQNTEEL